MHLCLFEDPQSNNLLPLTYFRPVYDLRCGALSLGARVALHLRPASLTLLVREYLVPALREENPTTEINEISPGECLFVNGRTIMTATLARDIRRTKKDCVMLSGSQIVAARLSGENLVKARSSGYSDAFDLSDVVGVESFEVSAELVSYPWDLVYANEKQIENDFSAIDRHDSGRRLEIHKSASLIGRKNIRIGGKSSIGAGAVLDASEGPIYVGAGVKVLPTAFVQGPCFIGDGSTIKAGARIYGNTSIGVQCKVGGEVANSILHSHVNKQHDGYIGHSYISPWVNLGAGTTTSNLKNTYGNVRVRISGREVDSEKMFVGLIAGDHVKIGINGALDTGTVIGPSSNLYGTSIPPKYIPAFTWGTVGDFATYDLERAVAVADTVMHRRNMGCSDAYKMIFRQVFEMTSNERISFRA